MVEEDFSCLDPNAFIAEIDGCTPATPVDEDTLTCSQSTPPPDPDAICGEGDRLFRLPIAGGDGLFISFRHAGSFEHSFFPYVGSESALFGEGTLLPLNNVFFSNDYSIWETDEFTVSNESGNTGKQIDEDLLQISGNNGTDQFNTAEATVSVFDGNETNNFFVNVLNVAYYKMSNSNTQFIAGYGKFTAKYMWFFESNSSFTTYTTHHILKMTSTVFPSGGTVHPTNFNILDFCTDTQAYNRCIEDTTAGTNAAIAEWGEEEVFDTTGQYGQDTYYRIERI
mgnify:CR=1 FL=1